ncbi:MYPOP protein, partial [Tachuris rubrigastra]|nr:MYPOP protein [Tachuris rubrigastra]
MSEVLRYEPLLFGAAAGTVNAYEKQKIWWRITHKVNAAGRHQRDIGEVKNRWRGLRRRAGDKISRHRLERQGPAGRATGRSGANAGNGSGPAEPGPAPAPPHAWTARGTGHEHPAPALQGPAPALQGPAPHGVKEEPVKEEPVEVKTEPDGIPAVPGVPGVPGGRGPERRLPREGWSRSPPVPAPPEVALGELGGQQDPLGSDLPSLLLEPEPEPGRLSRAEEGPPGAGGPDGTPESPELSLARSNERLVREMREFRREYAESRRESTAVLRSIAQALAALGRSLSEIRDLYLRDRGGPKP